MNKKLLTLLPLLAILVVIPAYALVPSEPINFVATNQSTTQINLTWDPPLDNGGEIITGYDVQRTLLQLQNFTSIITLNGSSTSYNDNGLLPDTGYNYQVIAINTDGNSIASLNANATTNSIQEPPVIVPVVQGEFPTAEFSTKQAETFNLSAPTGLNIIESVRGESSYTERYSDGNPDTLDVYKTITAEKRLANLNGDYSSPYYKTEDANMVMVETPEGSFVWNKSACAITFYNGELITESSVPVIGSDSFTFQGTQVGNTNWNELTALNNASCQTEVFEDGTNIEVRGTKTSAGQAEVKIRYIKLAGDLLKPQLEVTNLNPAWDNHKLAIKQTIHVPDNVKLGDTIYNIEQFNGTSVDRTWIQEHGADFIQLTDKVHYDIGLGFPMLTQIDVVYEDSTSKLVFDYSNTEMVIAPNETLILDPLYGELTSGEYRTSTQGTGSTCTTLDANDSVLIQPFVGSTVLGGGNTCQRGVAQADISAIPNYADISDVSLAFTITGATNARVCDYYAMETNTIDDTVSQRWNDAGNGTQYVNDDTLCQTNGAKVLDLGASAVTDFQTNLQAGGSYFGVGVKVSDETRDGSHHYSQLTVPVFQITYTVPVPTTPTTQVTVDEPTSKTVTSTNSTTPVGNILGTYFNRVNQNSTYTCEEPEPYGVSCQGLVSYLTLDGPATGLQERILGNFTSLIGDGKISTDGLLAYYEFEPYPESVTTILVGDDFKTIDSGTNATVGVIDLIPSGDYNAENSTITWTTVNSGSSAGSMLQYHTSNHVGTSGAFHMWESYNTSCSYGIGEKGITANIDLTNADYIIYSYKIDNITGVTDRIDIGGALTKAYTTTTSGYVYDFIDVRDETGSTAVKIYADRDACGVNRNTNFYVSNFKIIEGNPADSTLVNLATHANIGLTANPDESFDTYSTSDRTADAVWGTNADQTIETLATYVDEADSDASWTSDDETNIDVNLTNDEVDWTTPTGSPNIRMTYDLGAGAVSNDNWVLRFKHELSTTFVHNTVAQGKEFYVALTSDAGEPNVAKDYIGFTVSDLSSAPRYRMNHADNVAVTSNSNETPIREGLFAGEILYFELKRLSPTLLQLNAYSDSSYTNLIHTVSDTVVGTVEDLRYFYIGGSGGATNGVLAGHIDDIVFYDKTHTIAIPDLQKTADFTDLYTTNSGWTVGGSSNIVVDSGDSNQVDFNSPESGANRQNHYAYKSLGLTLSDDSWSYRFMWMWNTFGSPTVGHNPVMLSAGSAWPLEATTNQDAIAFSVYNAVGTVTSGYKDDSGLLQRGTTITGLSVSTQYYMELLRESSTSIVLNVYSDPEYTTLVATQQQTIPATVVGLTHLQHVGTEYSAGAGFTFDGQLDNSYIYNGVPNSREWANNWEVQDESKNYVDLDKDAIALDIVADSTNDGMHYALTDVSDSNWVLRASFQFDNLVQGGDSAWWFGLSDSDSSTPRLTAQDFIGVSFDNRVAPNEHLCMKDFDGALLGTCSAPNFDVDWSTGIMYDIEIIRVSPILYTVNLYTGNYTTLVGSSTNAVASTVVNTDYLVIKNVDASTVTGSWSGKMHNIQFYNNEKTISYGNNFDGVLWNGVVAGDSVGVRDQAYDFDGTGDWVALGDKELVAVGDTDATASFSAWVNFDTLGGADSIIAKLSASACTEDGRQWIMEKDASDRLEFLWYGGLTSGGAYRGYATDATFTTGQWYHVVATLDLTKALGSEVTLYIDGVSQPYTTTLTFGTPVSVQDGPAQIGIGSNIKSDGTDCGSGEFDGQIDDVAVFNRVLTGSEVLTYYNTGRSIDAITGVGGAIGGTVPTSDLRLDYNFDDGQVRSDYYDVSELTFNNNAKSVSAQESVVSGMAWNNNGTKMFIQGQTGDDVNEYACTTAYLPNSCTFTDATSISGQSTVPSDITWNPAGTKMYITDQGNAEVDEYSCTAFDASTCSYTDNLDVSTQESAPNDWIWNNDGTKGYLTGENGDNVDEFSCTAYDVSTCTDSTSPLTTGESFPAGMTWNNDGTEIFIVGHGSDSIREYGGCTAYDVSTCTFVDSLSVSSQEITPQTIEVNGDGSRFYVIGNTGNDINEYRAPTYVVNQATLDFFNQTVTFSDDFDTDDWIDSSNALADVDDVTDLRYEMEASSPAVNEDVTVIDVGLISESFVYRGKINLDTMTAGGSSNNLIFFWGLSDSDQNTGYVTAHDTVHSSISIDNSAPHVGAFCSNNGASMGACANTLDTPVEGIYYFEFASDGEEVIFTRYADPEYTIVLETNIQPYTVDNLRYLVFHAVQYLGSSNHVLNVYVDDVEFYNGFSTYGAVADGTVSGAVLGVSGKYNQAYNFDGVDDYISTFVPVTSDNRDFTATAWVKTDTITPTQVIMGSMDTDNEQEDFAMTVVASTGLPVCWKRTDSTTNDADLVTGTTALPIGQWTHIACVYDDSLANDSANLPTDSLKVYVNGVMEDNTPSDNAYTGGGAITFRIGDDGTIDEFDGSIDDVAIYHRTLTNNEISTLAESFPVSTGTLANTAKIFYEFDGTGQVLQETTNAGRVLASGNDLRVGLKAITGSALIGTVVEDVSFKLAKNASPTGTATVVVRDSGDSIVHTFGTINPATDITTSYLWYTFYTGSYTLVADDRILIEYSGGDTTNRIDVNYQQSDVYDSTNTYLSLYIGSSYSDNTGYDVGFKINNGIENQASITNYNPTALVDEDFISCTTDTCNGAYVVSDNTQFDVDIAQDEIDTIFDRDSSADEFSYDIEEVVCNPECTFRWQYDLDSQVDSSTNVSGFVLLSSGITDVGTNTGLDSVGWLHYKAGAGTSAFYSTQCPDNRPTSCTSNIFADGSRVAGSTYWELTKFDGSIMVCEYSSSAYTQPKECITTALTGSWYEDDGLDPLQYLLIDDQNDSSTGSMTGSIPVWSLYDDFAVFGAGADGSNDGATTGVTGIRGNAYDFDGTNDVISSINPFDDNEDFSVSAWVKIDAQGVTYPFISTVSTDEEQEDFELRMDGTLNTVHFYKKTDNTTNDADYVGDNVSTVFLPNQWYHIAVTYDDSVANDLANVPTDSYRLYVNGVMEDNTPADVAFGSATVIDMELGSNTNSEYFNGQLDDVAFFKGIHLTDSQVQQLYNGGNSLDVVDGFTGANGVVVYPYLTLEAGTEQYKIAEIEPADSAVWGRLGDQTIEDGTTYTSQGDADTFWIDDTGGLIQMDASLDKIEIVESTPTDEGMSFDIGTADISGSWVLTVPIHATTVTHGAEGSNPFQNQFLVGLSDTTRFLGATNYVGFRYEVIPWQNDGIALMVNDGSALVTFVASGTEKMVSGTDYCVEIINDVNLEIYTLRLYASATCIGLPVHELIDTASTGVDSLRYFTIQHSYLTTEGAWSVELDDITLTPWAEGGKIGGSMHFDGSTYYTTATEIETTYDFAETESQSWAFWISPLLDGTHNTVIDKRVTANGDGYQIEITTSDFVQLTVDGTGAMTCVTDVALSGGIWNHVVITKAGTTSTTNCVDVNMYLDGSPVSFTSGGTNPTTSIENDNDITIGATTVGTQQITGQLDELRFYATELTPLQVSTLYSYNTILNGTLVDTTVNAENTYSYKSASVNQNGQSDWSEFSTGSSNFTVPTAPLSLGVTTTSTTELELSWTTPTSDGNQPITGYKIERESPIGNGFTTLIADTGNNNISYNNTILLSATQYNYRVSAINSVGISTTSNEAYNWTQPESPISPSAVPVTTVADQINLEWTAPSGTVTGYLIEYETPIGNGFVVLEANYTGGLYYNHTGLTENTTYNYRIASITNPVGPYSPPFNATTGDAPDAPLNVTATIVDPILDPLNILVSWNAPIDIGDNTVITGYDIIRSVNGANYTSLVNDTAGLTYNDLAVSINTNYTYAVSAKGDVINGNFSGPSNTIVTGGVPNAPTGVSASVPVPLTPYEILVSWSAPVDNGGSPIIDYTLWRSLDDITFANITATGNVTSYLDTVPSVPATTYYYKLATENIIGFSANSTSANVTTASVPSPPLSLTVLPLISQAGFALDWVTPTSDGGTPINGYQIQINIDDAGWTTVISNTGNNNTYYEDLGRSQTTNYKYAVYAINQIGGSSGSSVVQGEFTNAVLTPMVTPLVGNAVQFDVNVNMTYGIPNNEIYGVELRYWGSGNLVTQIYPAPSDFVAKNGAMNYTMYDNLSETTEYYILVLARNGELGEFSSFQSSKLIGSPSIVFNDSIAGVEYRNESYNASNLQIIGTPSNYDLVVVYREQNNLDNEIVLTWDNVIDDAVAITDVDPTKRYYVSGYFTPSFNYTVGAQPINGTATIPAGYPVDISLISIADPNQVGFTIGIDVIAGESGIFGLPLVFIFIIALASIFTGRSAPMGIIFIAVALGFMAYMGLIDFDFDPANDSNTATWAIIIVAVIVGVMVGKRWD